MLILPLPHNLSTTFSITIKKTRNQWTKTKWTSNLLQFKFISIRWPHRKALWHISNIVNTQIFEKTHSKRRKYYQYKYRHLNSFSQSGTCIKYLLIRNNQSCLEKTFCQNAVSTRLDINIITIQYVRYDVIPSLDVTSI